MMKRILLALGFLLFAAPVWAATCTNTTLQIKDNLGATPSVTYVDDGTGSGNCIPQLNLKSGTVTAIQGPANATPWNQNLSQMGGTAINSACVAALNGFGSTIPSTVCGVFGTYVLNANTNVGNNSDAVTAGGAAGSPVVNYNYGFNGTTWDRLQVDGSKNLKVVFGVANQAINVAQVNGVTTLTGAGAVGTGAQRIAVGQDTTTIAGSNPGRTYNTIAASQTTQALTGGSGGALGDYLSHCVVIPTSTSPGVVTIIDNATTIYGFPGGASSLSNLVPFTIPVGAYSTSGAWKVTTGANLSVVCVGKFT